MELNEWLKPWQVGKRKASHAVKSGSERKARQLEPPPPSGPLTPHAAVSRVDGLLGLSEDEKEALRSELLCTDEDPILVLKENPAWNAVNPAGSAAVINAIATWGAPPARRDNKSPGLLFHFHDAYQLDQCKIALMAAHPNAFSPSPTLVATLLASGGAIGALNVIPMAFTAVVHKVGVRQDDVQDFQFFYY